MFLESRTHCLEFKNVAFIPLELRVYFTGLDDTGL